jgi:gliding motility-associated-like protein
MIKKLLLSLLLFSATGLVFGQTVNPGRDVPVVGQGTESGEVDALRLFIPNAFTPNDDGVNDFFYITNSSFSVFNFSVFDRWGNQVYVTNNSNFQWDGKINGKPVPTDIYVFVFQGTTLDNLEIKRSGTISVVR